MNVCTDYTYNIFPRVPIFEKGISDLKMSKLFIYF